MVRGCTERTCIMHLLGLEELPDTSDLLYGLGKVQASNLMAREASIASARTAKLSPRKRPQGQAGEGAAPGRQVEDREREVVPIRRPRRVPGGDPLEVSLPPAMLLVCAASGLRWSWVSCS